jgi:hypothetical protein
MTTPEKVDAVIIGANIRGLVATYVLSSLGYRAVLLERAPFIGGVDGSFKAPDGSWFEYGMHVLDFGRSDVATKLFTHVVDGQVHRIQLKRGIVLRNQIMPYAPEPAEMPEELRRMLPSMELTDDIGDELPTRSRLAECYGQEFADLILDETLPSLPTENRHRSFGVDESKLLTNIYPWFFPRADRKSKTGDESRAFHDQLRNNVDQHILYPREGGFGGFSKGFVSKFDPDIDQTVERARTTVHGGALLLGSRLGSALRSVRYSVPGYRDRPHHDRQLPAKSSSEYSIQRDIAWRSRTAPESSLFPWKLSGVG